MRSTLGIPFLFSFLRSVFKREPFDFVEGEGLDSEALARANKTLKRHRRRVSVFFRNSQILLQVAIGLKAGMYAVFVIQTFGLHASAQLQTISLTSYFSLNVIMGVTADSLLGRRKVYMAGTLLYTLSYLLYGIGTWESCVYAEVAFGVASACISGVLGVWFRNIIENTFYLRSRVNREELDNALIAIETNDYCRKSTKQVFGFRSIFMLIAGILGGFTSAYWNPSGVWFIAMGICLILSVYVWWHMFYNTIPVRPQPAKLSPYIITTTRWKRLWEHPVLLWANLIRTTVAGAFKALRSNPVVSSFVLIGISFSMIIQVVKIIWVPIVSPVMKAHDFHMWVATALTILLATSGGIIVILFERTKRYKRKVEAEQTKYEFSALRNCIALIGIMLICLRWVTDMNTIAVVLLVFMTGGIFARIHAGSITSNTPAKSRRLYGSTMLSIYETAVAASAIVSSIGISMLLKKFNWSIYDILALTGFIAIALALIIRYKDKEMA